MTRRPGTERLAAKRVAAAEKGGTLLNLHSSRSPRRLALLLTLCLLLSGCASLLERSYSVVEPYTDRYRDSGGEDALRAENYQDLVNSLMMLVEQRAEEGTIRCYEEANSYSLARAASLEVRRDTILGSYLLESLTFSYEGGAGFSTLTCRMAYRADAEDLGGVMTLSDSQSLVDLLRLAVREAHEKQTVQFVSDTSQEEVAAAMDVLWQELCRGEDKPDAPPPAEELAPADGENEPDQPPESDESPPEEAEVLSGEDVQEDGELPPESPEIPPCPWTARLYPSRQAARIVEISLYPQKTAEMIQKGIDMP